MRWILRYRGVGLSGSSCNDSPCQISLMLPSANLKASVLQKLTLSMLNSASPHTLLPTLHDSFTEVRTQLEDEVVGCTFLPRGTFTPPQLVVRTANQKTCFILPIPFQSSVSYNGVKIPRSTRITLL